MTTSTALAPPPAAAVSPRAERVASALLLLDVGWLVATGRWGSYVGGPGGWLFLTDVLLLLTVISLLPLRLRLVERFARVRRDPLLILVLALGLLALVRFVCQLKFSQDGVRDFAPYGYAGVALLAIVSRSSLRLRLWHLVVVFVFHAAWVYASPKVFPHWVPPQIGPIHFFDLRNDFDSAVCGVAAAFSIIRLVACPNFVRRVLWLAFAAFNVYLVLQLQNRAALIATVAAMGAAVVCVLGAWAHTQLHVSRRRQVLGVLGIMVLVGLAVPYASHTATVTKVSNSLRGNSDANGTLQARQEVYRLVTDYVWESPERVTVGVGFGPDFLHETGADRIYEGTEYTGVRAPHNILVGDFARLGLGGAIFRAVLMLYGIGRALVVLRRPQPPAVQFAALLAVALPFVALLGVIMESPFGAVPYFWALGTLVLADRRASTGRHAHS